MHTVWWVWKFNYPALFMEHWLKKKWQTITVSAAIHCYSFCSDAKKRHSMPEMRNLRCVTELVKDADKEVNMKGKPYIQEQNVQTMTARYGVNSDWSVCGKGWLTECVGETLGRLARQLDGEEATVSDSQHTAEQLATYLYLSHAHAHKVAQKRPE